MLSVASGKHESNRWQQTKEESVGGSMQASKLLTVVNNQLAVSVVTSRQENHL
jgi:hypothetical protein